MYEVLGYLFKAGSFWVTLVCILKPMRNKQKEANRVDEHMCSLAREHEFILCVRLLFSATSDTTDFSTDSMQYTFPSSQRQHYERNGSTRERDELRYVITNNNVIMQPHSWEMKTNLIWLFYTVSLCLSLSPSCKAFTLIRMLIHLYYCYTFYALTLQRYSHKYSLRLHALTVYAIFSVCCSLLIPDAWYFCEIIRYRTVNVISRKPKSSVKHTHTHTHTSFGMALEYRNIFRDWFHLNETKNKTVANLFKPQFTVNSQTMNDYMYHATSCGSLTVNVKTLSAFLISFNSFCGWINKLRSLSFVLLVYFLFYFLHRNFPFTTQLTTELKSDKHQIFCAPFRSIGTPRVNVRNY